MNKCVALMALSTILSATVSGCNLAEKPQMTNVDAQEGEVQIKIKQAKEHVKALGAGLKTRLQQAIKSGGLTAGVEECQLAAGPIAESLSKNGWVIGRTSLKVRNPGNAPDDWEREQLAHFSSLLEKNKLTSEPLKRPLDTYQYDDESGEFRYMMAIEQGQICMACHGTNIAPAVKDVIAKHYPDDQATGFEVGDLRGAFTLTYRPK
ncbi:DUF3365 domain-containing protein [Alteromonas sp. BL110]|uniref:Tll0287-like domain-containing protein n=1 Tax=Alteromonas sp. BL110 TaxID=1714845 RepID=UPI000E4AF178|nr:DUF3365 domain-containing protein [Alteromonas sp. BL110]AXT38785.1 DUF3365 domain-containing protein [Alteromonas sp. BL110]RKM83067.1 DUF3365 domain-containing protein [Alteromonas sp. BL110]